jgi:hypothetical protein
MNSVTFSPFKVPDHRGKEEPGKRDSINVIESAQAGKQYTQPSIVTTDQNKRRKRERLKIQAMVP